MSKTFLFQAIQFTQTIQFSISMLLVLFNPYIGPSRCYQSGPEWTWEQWQWRGTPYSPKLQHCWNLTIRLFSVMSRTLVSEGSYPSAVVQSVYSTTPADWAKGRNDQPHNNWMQQISTEYKTRHDWVGKVIHWELCKKSKFDQTSKWYMHNTESVLKNKTHEFPGFLRYEQIR